MSKNRSNNNSPKRRGRKIIIKRDCPLCEQGLLHVDYKYVELLNQFTAHNGRILARRITGLCAKHQRMVSNAIKRARFVALMPFIKE